MGRWVMGIRQPRRRRSRRAAAGVWAALTAASPAIGADTIFEISRVSVHSDGTQADTLSRAPAISDNGRFVAFESSSGLLVDERGAVGSAAVEIAVDLGPLIFEDGFESGSTGAWSGTVQP